MTKDQIYDNEIKPLMKQILEVCKRDNIAMVASFALTGDNDPEGALLCTSGVLVPETNPPMALLTAMSFLYP